MASVSCKWEKDTPGDGKTGLDCEAQWKIQTAKEAIYNKMEYV